MVLHFKDRSIPRIKMSLRTPFLCRAVVVANRRAVLPTATSRQYSAQAYPFTKPTDSTSSQAQEDGPPKTAYPFTQPTGPKIVAPPTRPTPQPGPSAESSELVSSEAMDEGAISKPDYGAMEDYRTSYDITEQPCLRDRANQEQNILARSFRCHGWE